MVRNTYIIIPLKASAGFSIDKFEVSDGEEIGFDSDSMSDLVRHKCDVKQDFVKRFRLNKNLSISFDDGYVMNVMDTQLVVFENSIGFLCVLFSVNESNVYRIYDFVNPGYLIDKHKELQYDFISELRETVLDKTSFDIYVEGDSKKLAIKESYLFNAAFTDYRFDNLKDLEKATFNVHKHIAIEYDFEDNSEVDIAYTYGARDVENNTYRWGSCISSQSISFVYGPTNSNYNVRNKKAIIPAENIDVHEMITIAEDDLLLSILALYQRFTCMVLTEKVYNGIYKEGSKNIKKIKSEMLRFRAFGTITPSQISRWNNVCQTFEYLLKMNGVDEALNDIDDKINLINEEEDNISGRHQNYIATIIALFGLISIIASVQQIVDYLMQGNHIIRLWTEISSIGAILMCVVFAVLFGRR